MLNMEDGDSLVFLHILSFLINFILLIIFILLIYKYKKIYS